jgi:hypothetical protein
VSGGFHSMKKHGPPPWGMKSVGSAADLSIAFIYSF